MQKGIVENKNEKRIFIFTLLPSESVNVGLGKMQVGRKNIPKETPYRSPS
jgi:hypothetical protein